jgi:glycosyltransferase involved in cell wall biosynthesis
MQKKILLASHSSELGGAELCFVETLKALHSMGKYELYVFLPSSGDLVNLCEPYCEEINFSYLPWWIDSKSINLKQRLKRFINIVVSSIKAFKIIRRIKPSYIITNTSTIPSFALAALFSTAKHLWFIHELVDEGLNMKYIYGKKTTKHIIGLTSYLVISNSNFVNSNLSDTISKRKLKTVYQPVEIDIPKTNVNISKKTLSLLIIGNISVFKGQLEAILACQELHKMGIDFELNVVGVKPGPYLDLLKSNISTEISTKVNLIHFSDKPQLFYEKADIVLVCSKCEALGRISIEAMKMGLPVIASNRGGNLELIRNGLNGLLYEYGNPSDLALKISQLDDQTLRVKMGKAGKEWADGMFNTERFKLELLDCIL